MIFNLKTVPGLKCAILSSGYLFINRIERAKCLLMNTDIRFIS